VQTADRRHRLQRSTHCSLGVIVMGIREAKVGQDPIAQELPDLPAIPHDRVNASFVIAPHCLEKVLGIKTRGKGRRIYEVKEDNRQRSSLSARWCQAGPRVKRDEGSPESYPVANRQTKLTQFRVGKLAQLVKPNSFCAESWHVLTKAGRV
jgi:hypothetical protein